MVAGVALVMLAAGAAGAAAQEARVFFVSPADGSQHSEDVVSIEFGAENYPISAIPEGFDQETGTPREGVGHYHLGYNTGCLPVGEITPQGEGWQHFGDGSNTTTLENAPAGTYELTVQIGDDQHRTQEGLCATDDQHRGDRLGSGGRHGLRQSVAEPRVEHRERRAP